MTTNDLIVKVALLKQLYRKALLTKRNIFKLEKELNDIDNDFSNVVNAICKSLRENENDDKTNL